LEEIDDHPPLVPPIGGWGCGNSDEGGSSEVVIGVTGIVVGAGGIVIRRED